MATRQPDAPTFADLFGIGSLRLAFEEYGARCIWACPSDPESAKTYRENFGGDAFDHQGQDISAHDILLANLDAFPMSGRKESATWTLDLILDILVAKRPAACLLAIAARPGERRAADEPDAIIQGLNALGYFIHRATVDARQYGLPHMRRTTFTVGFDHDSGFKFPAGRRRACSIDSILETNPSEKYYLSEAERDRIIARRTSSGMKGLDWRFQFVADGCANTLTDRPGSPYSNIVIDAEGRWRLLTEREVARVQGFTDSFITHPDRRKAYRQFARAVPIPCAAAIAKRIVAVLRPNGFARPVSRNGKADGRHRTAREPGRSSGRLQGVLRWYGSLTHYATRIVKLFPPHDCYVEVFGGSAACLFAKAPSREEVYADIFSNLTTFFKVLRTPKLRRRLIDLVEMTPYSREEFEEALDVLDKSDGKDTVRIAHAFLTSCNQARNGRGARTADWAYGKGKAKTNAGKWARLPARLAWAGQRLKAVQVENLPFEDILRRYDSSESTLFLIDPPYHPQTLVSPGVYSHSFTNDDHERLLRMALNIRGKAVICGYDIALYSERLSGWATVKLDGRSYASPRANGKPLPKRTLTLWMNYDPPRP